MQEIARKLFSGPALVLVQLMLIAVISWIAVYIAYGLGKKQIAQMIQTAATFVCISLVIATIWGAVSKAATVMGF